MCINRAHIVVDRNLKRTSAYLETHILVGVRLKGVYSFLRLAYSVSVIQSKGESQSSKSPPTKHFPFQDGSDGAVRGSPLEARLQNNRRALQVSLSAAAPCRQAGAAGHENTSCLQGKV